MPFDETNPLDFFELCEKRLRDIAASNPREARRCGHAIMLRTVRLLEVILDAPPGSSNSPTGNDSVSWLSYFKREHNLSIPQLAKMLGVTPATVYGWKTRGKLSSARQKELEGLARKLQKNNPPLKRSSAEEPSKPPYWISRSPETSLRASLS
jgi:hypothetical protein